MCTFFGNHEKAISKFDQRILKIKALSLIFCKKMFTQGFYFYSFDIVMDFFHLESHSITLVKENINLIFLFIFLFFWHHVLCYGRSGGWYCGQKIFFTSNTCVYIEFLHSRINKSKIYILLLFLKSFQLLIVIVFLYDLNNNHCKIRMHVVFKDSLCFIWS